MSDETEGNPTLLASYRNAKRIYAAAVDAHSVAAERYDQTNTEQREAERALIRARQAFEASL